MANIVGLSRRIISRVRVNPKRGRATERWRALRRPSLYYPLNNSFTNYGSYTTTAVNHGGAFAPARFGLGIQQGSATDADYIDLGFSTRFSSIGFTSWIFPTSVASGKVRMIFNNTSYYADAYANFPINFYVGYDSVTGLGTLGLTLSKGDDYSSDAALIIYGLTMGTPYFVGFSYQDYVKANIYCNGTYTEALWPYAVSTSPRNYTIGRAAFPYGGGVNSTSFYGVISDVRVFFSPQLGILGKEDYNVIYNLKD